MEIGNGKSLPAVTPEVLVKVVKIGRKDVSDSTTSTFFGENVTYQQMMSDEVMTNINLYINVLLCGSLAIFGTCNNAVNMIIFYKLGLKDSMSVYLFGLSLTDFLMSALVAVTRTFPIWGMFFYYKDDKIDPMIIYYAGCLWIMESLFLCSGWITTCLSLERCICVMFPFKVKRLFTRNRSIFCVVFFHVVTVVPHIPIYLSHRLIWTKVETGENNGTTSERRLGIVFSKNRLMIEEYMELVNVAIISLPSVIIILVSVSWMAYGLTMSSLKRESMIAANTERAEGERQDSKMAYKTRRLVKVVIMLAIIYTICSVPRTFATIVNIVMPEINESGRERNLARSMWQFVSLFSTINSSVNIFVYLMINSSYKAKFHQLFTC